MAGSAATNASPKLRPTSYILIGDDQHGLTSQAHTSNGAQQPSQLDARISTEDVLLADEEDNASSPILIPVPAGRPRYFIFLPLIATLDLLTCAALTSLLLYGEGPSDAPSEGDEEASAEKTRRLIFALAASGAIRAITVGVIGCSRRVRELTIAVAAICLVSILVIVSVSNVLFLLPAQAWNDSDRSIFPIRFPRHLDQLPRLTIAYLSGQQLLFTLFEWALFVSVVGVRVPPGGVNAAGARRWQAELAAESWDGEVGSLYEDRTTEQVRGEEGEQAAEAGMHDDDDGDEVTAEAPRTPHLFRPTSSLSSAARATSGPVSPTPHYNESSGVLSVSPPQDTLSPLPRSPAASISRRSIRSPLHAQHHHANTRDLERQAPPSLGFPGGGAGAAEGEAGEDELDPDDIVDINPNDRRLSRQESKRRLHAAKARGEHDRERKVSSTSVVGAASLFSRSPTNAGSAATSTSPNASRSHTPTGEHSRLVRGSSGGPGSDGQAARSRYGSTDLSSAPSAPPSRSSSSQPSSRIAGINPSASFSSTSSSSAYVQDANAQDVPSSGPRRLAHRIKRPSWLPSTKKARRSASGQ